MTTYEKVAIAMVGAVAVYSYSKARKAGRKAQCIRSSCVDNLIKQGATAKEAIAECCD